MASTLRDILCELRDLLAPYDQDVQAIAGLRFVQNAIAEYDANSPQLRDTLNSVDFWGGPGSLFDLLLNERNSSNRAPDNLAKDRLMRRLAGEMIFLGIASRRVVDSAEALDRLIEFGESESKNKRK